MEQEFPEITYQIAISGYFWKITYIFLFFGSSLVKFVEFILRIFRSFLLIFVIFVLKPYSFVTFVTFSFHDIRIALVLTHSQYQQRVTWNNRRDTKSFILHFQNSIARGTCYLIHSVLQIFPKFQNQFRLISYFILIFKIKLNCLFFNMQHIKNKPADLDQGCI